MQKVRSTLPTILPLFFLDIEEAVRIKPKKGPGKVIEPRNNKQFKIEYMTPTGRLKDLVATFKSKKDNAIFYDRWEVKGRRTTIQHGPHIRIYAQL